ncbi:fumarylacetoacetate hydrolase family protein [Flaviramulus sp. BrNp1-15]|uniref:fumarylacetoacetate hydrolase family protein n=1 Tax=Flaviramulus sp. BrNp1-15 TaxID=2916754 RepID=UPI001EE7BC3F|nr:fumarylacetoacetate hydrolase family protein [Flaviramulus sp. BrNp1-15]ULC60715.1 fumarylacetoacetate hydrolase family protein [Flaviramulus sp. BrNp1-15]
MKIYNTKKGIIIQSENSFHLINDNWDDFINNDNLASKLNNLVASLKPIQNAEKIIENDLLVPMQSQELWASGVTYYNSKLGRQEESKDAGGGDYYERVYNADRPELFFKATVNRTVPSGGKVNIRKDSTWDVPEPELTLVITSSGKIIGYTIGNDMSSRSIEGENPLYLPQAKTYDACAGLGPCVYITDEVISDDSKISMKIIRNNEIVFEEAIKINQMKRKPKELVDYLYRECSFEYGSLLMTGTGIVPTTEFTLKSEDEIQISIDNIGTLINYVR